jgi:type VI secretion system protein VasG
MQTQTPSFYFKKLNPFAYGAMDTATERCIERSNPELELAHWLLVLVEKEDSDLVKIIRHFGGETSRTTLDINRFLDSLPRGASRMSAFSRLLVDALEQAWVCCSLVFGRSSIRSGHVILAAARNSTLRAYLGGVSKEFQKINAQQLEEAFNAICAGSAEDDKSPASSEDAGSAAPSKPGESALERFSVDLTAKAREGKIDPVVCRDDEIRQVVDILMRRRQNNPLLAGEAGVGKTAVVEGFALKLAAGEVPDALRDVTLRTLDIGLLQAGASMKGEFEDRLRKVIQEVQSSPKPIILFIDEAHTLIGAGGAEGVGDAANLLKPALARGELRTIAATTWGEYKKYIEKDPALTRRFQVVKVEEPDEISAAIMLRGVVDVLERHHKIDILDDAVKAAVRLSHRYIPARQLPDKAVSLLDTACARVALTQSSPPAQLERRREAIRNLTIEKQILERESRRGADVSLQLSRADEALAREEAAKQELEVQWKKEQALIDELKAAKLAADESGDSLAVKMLESDLKTLQGETPLISPIVDEHVVASVVSDWTGIPLGKMVRDEIENVLNLPARLKKRVIGQDHALEMIAKRIVTARAGIDNPSKPIGVFLLAGTSGVGKTETALALAETLYGGETNVITINMSEFQEAHTVSTLKGAPPGYVGYGEGGVLTEAVRRRPYSIVLLDEVEKAHPDVHEIFFQVFDKGFMEDGEGRYIDFRNTIILLTSNAGTDTIMSLCSDPELVPEPEKLAESLRKPLLDVFPPALIGRLVTIPYYPLSPDNLKKIIRLQLDRIKKRVESQKLIPFTYGEDVVDLVFERCRDADSGARVIDSILTNTMLPEIGRRLLEAVFRGDETKGVSVSVSSGDFLYQID